MVALKKVCPEFKQNTNIYNLQHTTVALIQDKIINTVGCEYFWEEEGNNNSKPFLHGKMTSGLPSPGTKMAATY